MFALDALPPPGSDAERAEFLRLQARLPRLFREVFRDRLAPRTVVVAPGLSLDAEVLSKIAGVRHYEERMLSMLMLLRMPNTQVIFLTSEPIPSVVIDYYLSQLPGIPTEHARARLRMLSAHDASPASLTRKLLDRPRLLARIRSVISDPGNAHLSVFNATADEVSLAVALGIPMYACDPALADWGGKSGSRRAFRQAGVALPDGAEDLTDLDDAAEALNDLLARAPGLRRAVLKLDQGFSGAASIAFRRHPPARSGAQFDWRAVRIRQTGIGVHRRNRTGRDNNSIVRGNYWIRKPAWKRYRAILHNPRGRRSAQLRVGIIESLRSATQATFVADFCGNE